MLLFSVIMITIAGVAVVSWLGYITEAQRQARRDRTRLYAFYAAEAGVEEVVDYFNNPANFTGTVPQEYTTAMATSPHTLPHNVHPDAYTLFEPYVLDYEVDDEGRPIDSDGLPIFDTDGNLTGTPVVTTFTYFQDYGNGLQSKIPTCTVYEADEPDEDETNSHLVSRDDWGNALGWVTELRLENPDDFDTNGMQRVICKVIATGQASNGVSTTVEMLLRENPTLVIRSPGAIVTEAAAEFDGNFHVHWGELWAKSDVELQSNETIKIPKETEDPWFKLRTEGMLLDSSGTKYADGTVSGGYSDTPVASTAANYEIPFLESVMHADNFKGGANSWKDYENLRQHQNLDFPSYDYDEWKRFFLINSLPYYFMHPDGRVCGTDPDTGEVVCKDYFDWFDIDPSDPDYFDMMDQLVFIDTVPTDADGNYTLVNDVPVRDSVYHSREPNRDIGNMVTLRATGNSMHTRGAMFVAADVYFGGEGNPPSSDSILDEDGNEYVVDPAGNGPQQKFKVAHNGFFFAWGQIDTGGNRTIYGSVFAGDGYGAGGTPEVYYDYRLRDGSWMNLNQSVVERTLWNIAGL
ncbi:hypothetical protein KQI84_05640 [bacterium]|nr:hypothetical protein [bacterium]